MTSHTAPVKRSFWRSLAIGLLIALDLIALVVLTLFGIVNSMTATLFCDKPGLTAADCWSAGKQAALNAAKPYLAVVLVINLLAIAVILLTRRNHLRSPESG